MNAPNEVFRKKIALIDLTSRSLASENPKAPDASPTLTCK